MLLIQNVVRILFEESESYWIIVERIISEIINGGMELKVSAFTILYQRDKNNVGAETGANPAEWANTTNAIKTTEYAKEST